ncbi:MAG: hypothetical protein KAW09_00215 [Thermoplasmata archaeon]|nr:hypothetical protein [Thermoplasmata archaeon]
MESILFYYYSLPEFPENCKLVRSRELMLRDVFICNPTNRDHCRYPIFEDHSYDEGCHAREVRTILDREKNERCVLLYTRYIRLDGSNGNYVVGIYDVGKEIRRDGERGFKSKNPILLDKNKMLPIPYSSRGVPRSWGEASISKRLNAYVEVIKKLEKFNCQQEYRRETQRLLRMLGAADTRSEIVRTCLECNSSSCYLLKRLARDANYLDRLYPTSGIERTHCKPRDS